MNRKVRRTISVTIALLFLFSGNLTVYAFSKISDPYGDAAAEAGLKPWLAANQPPVIDVWYESNLQFGELGNPQRQVNILGNVRDDGTVVSLTYSLNGAAPVPLDMGPNTTRLVNLGDFNVSLNTNTLKDNENTLVLRATDNNGATQEKKVTFTYKRGRTWPLPYLADWSKSAVIQDQAQVVDGAWKIDTNTGEIYPTQTGYDRLIAIGDTNWTDYEVTVPITIRAFPSGSNSEGGVGIISRWRGHTGSGQPPTGWYDIGAYGYYSNSSPIGLALRLNNQDPLKELFSFSFNTTYIFKMRVETTPTGGRYSLKVWKKSQPEPSWNSAQFSNIVDTNNDMTGGSVLLVAHKANAAFGNVLICPIGATYPLDVSTSTGGSATTSDGKQRYACGEQALVTAVPDPGYTFSGWSGSVTEMTNPISLNMLKAYNLKANFTRQFTDPFKTFFPQIIHP